MSIMNDNQEIYHEMEHSTSGKHGQMAAKIIASVLCLSVGFAAGSIYQVAQKTNNEPLIPVSNSSGTLVPTASTPTVTHYTGNELSIAEIASMNSDSVVEITISATTTDPFYGTYTSTGAGSGVIISSDGYILTNNHVISGADDVKIRLHNGTEYTAKVVGSDSKTDIGILKVDATNLNPVTIGSSKDLVVGELVVAIGNPLGSLGGTVTDGIVSALEREIVLDGKKMNLIQTNAAINRGNSGGALFNGRGELVGIVVAKSSGLDVEGLGFAIPIDDVKTVINDIVDLGYVSGRPYLGVSLSTSKQTQVPNNSIWSFFYGQNATTTSYGAYVADVVAGSAADKAGIQKDDEIISINDKMITSASEVTAAVAEYEIGDTIRVGLVRDGRMLTVEATLQEYKGESTNS